MPPSRWASLVVAALLVSEGGAAGQAAVRAEWTALAPGLWYRRWTLSGRDERGPKAGHALRADPAVARITVLDARREGRATARVSALREESGAYLVVNGGFFDERSRPLGLVVGNGRETSHLRKLDQGVFVIAAGKPRIQHARDPLPRDVETALQSWPRLVVEGRPLSLKPQVSRRTSICLPGDGTVILVVVETAISLAELAADLARPASRGGLGCWAALNLDGGPSSQLSLATPGMSLEIEGGWPVPNGVAVVPR